MDDRKILLCYCGVASFDDGQVIEASFTEARIAWRCISHDHCPWCDRRFYKTDQGLGSAVGTNLHSQTASVTATATRRLVPLLSGSGSNLDRSNN